MINLSLSQTGDAGPDFTLSADWDSQIAPKEVREVFEQAFETIGEAVRPKPTLKQEQGEQPDSAPVPGDLAEAQSIEDLERQQKEAELSRLREAVGHLQMEVAQVKARLDECRGEREEALEQRDAARRERDAARRERGDFHDRLRQAQAINKSLENQLREAAEIAEKLQTEFSEYKSTKKRREANLKNRIKGLTEELAEDRAATAKAIETAKQQILADSGAITNALIHKSDAMKILDEIPQFGMPEPEMEL